MSIRWMASLAICAASLGAALGARGATIYDEAISGDLSNSGLSPTSLTLGSGSNLILGTTGRNTEGIADRDYFTFTLPTGYGLGSLLELAGTTTIGTFGFIGVQTGSQVTVPTDAQTADGLLGWIHYVTADSALDILPVMALPDQGSTGFAVPLTAGDYAFWIQDTGTGSASYGFDLQISPVPEPGTAGAILIAMVALAAARTRRLR